MRFARTSILALMASSTLVAMAPAGVALAASPGDVVITEIMQNPAAVDDADGEWFEVTNVTGDPIDLDGWTVSDLGSNSFTIGGTLVVDPGAYVVFGNNGDAGTNGGVTVDYVYPSGFAIANGDDEIILTEGTTVIDEVAYDGGPAFPDPTGASMNLDPAATTATANDTGANWCEATTPYGDGDLGTPGAANTSCGIAAGGLGDLLLTEIVVTPTGGEFVEIFNNGSGVVDLTNVYLTDATFSGTPPTYYYNIVTGADAGGGGFGDFNARFPAGATIAAGEYQTVAMSGSDAYAAEYGAAPTYELWEDGTADSVPDMLEATAGSINGQGGLTNGGEMVVLYTWDGASDLVADIDYVVWGDQAEAVDKTGVAIDGPDADSDTSTYAADTAIANQDVVAAGAHASGSSWQRDDLTEGAEAQSGGNGVDGSDETSEDVSATWCEAAPTPGATSDCTPVVTYTPREIYEVQGSGSISPYVGEGVEIDGIVVGDFQDSGELNGFFLQEATGDGDPATSDGIFVYEGGSSVDVAVGDLVTVTGTVVEYDDGGDWSDSITEVTSVASVVVDSSGNPLPAATEVVLPLTVDFETLEGMSVVTPQTLVISEFFNYDRYGEIVLTNPFDGLARHFQPTSYVAPGAPAQAELAKILENRLTLDDGIGGQNPEFLRMPDGSQFLPGNTFRGGDTVTGAVGVIDFARTSFRIQPTGPATYTQENPRPTEPEEIDGELRVVGLNVLNFFVTIDESGNTCGPLGEGCRGADTAEEFTRQRDKLINALLAMDGDIVGLVELENSAGDEALESIVTGLNDALGAGTYDYVPTGYIGEDVIRVGVIYKPAAVMPWGDHAILDSSVDPTFLDDLNRPSMAQSFLDLSNGGITTVAVNHFKSKGSGCEDIGDVDSGDGQGNCNATRTAAAAALVNWLGGDPTGSGQSDAIVIGDLNAYDEEDPIQVLLDAGYTDIDALVEGEFGYSYVFDGQWGSLDYSLTNPSLASQIAGATVWHVNADEPDALDYNTSFRGPDQQALYDDGPFRFSDHDPVITGLDLDVDAGPVIEWAIDEIEALQADGSLNRLQATLLKLTLSTAQWKVERGHDSAARAALLLAIKQLDRYVDRGVIAPEDGQPIIDALTAVRAGLQPERPHWPWGHWGRHW